jgi:hypothetical protein
MDFLDITATVSNRDRDRGILERIRGRGRGWLRTSSDRDIVRDRDRGILSLRDDLSGPLTAGLSLSSTGKLSSLRLFQIIRARIIGLSLSSTGKLSSLSGPQGSSWQGSDLDILDIRASRICRQSIMLFQWILRTMLFMG